MLDRKETLLFRPIEEQRIYGCQSHEKGTYYDEVSLLRRIRLKNP